MASEERAGAEVAYGDEECQRKTRNLLIELGFPTGLFPLKDLVEGGGVRETGFVWMKMKAPCEHLFKETGNLVRYSKEITAYAETGRVRKITGVKSKQMLMWVPVVEMSIDDNDSQIINFKTSVGIKKSYPATAFLTEEEKQMKLMA